MVHGTKSYGDERKATEVLKGYMKGIEDLYLKFLKEGEVPADSGRTSWGAPYRGRYAIVIDSRDNKEPFPHYGMIPHALYACIMDFGINHKELLSRLKQCKYCGTFWLIKQGGKKGRPNKYYCGKKCSRLFTRNTTDYENEYKKNYRAKDKKDLMEDMLKEIMNTCYVKKPGGKYRKLIDKKEAEEVYKRIPRKNKKDINILKQILGNEWFFVL